MWNRKHSATLSIVVCWVVVAVLTAAVFTFPWIVDEWFGSYRGWNENSVEYMMTLLLSTFYPCAVLAYVTLYNLIRMLCNIRREQVFIQRNVTHLRRISWCCFGVAGITLVSCVFYLPYLMIGVAAGFVGLMLRVVKNVMQSAVEIREENELTI